MPGDLKIISKIDCIFSTVFANLTVAFEGQRIDAFVLFQLTDLAQSTVALLLITNRH